MNRTTETRVTGHREGSVVFTEGDSASSGQK